MSTPLLLFAQALIAALCSSRKRSSPRYDRAAMPPRRAIDPAQTRAAVLAVAEWLRDDTRPTPARDELGAAVRLTARTLAAAAPGASVEVRIPPFVAVQCISGPQHRRGTPPNVVETDPRTWLLLATGLQSVADAADSGVLGLSGSRAGEIASFLPLVALTDDLRSCLGGCDSS